MYNAKIVTDSGQTFNFGYEYGSVFDIDPLTGVDVDLATSQGYQQIGETVEGQSVGGVNRTIKGVFIKNAATLTAEMLSKLPIFTTGKLYYNDDYFCEIVVKKTPVIYTNKVGVTNFSMLVFCSTPFWYASEKKIYRAHKYPAFTVPADCINNGVAQMEFTITIKLQSGTTIHDVKITNVNTNEFMQLNATLSPKEVITVYRKNGRLYVLKNDTEDIFSKLDENSNLFEIKTGHNELQISSSTSYSQIDVDIEFYEPYMGVINATD